MQFGYTAMCEQTPVKQLVRDLQASEQAGFDFSVISDHYFPWLEEQGHSGYTWAVLGAAAQATDRLPLMTMVTCPTFRYHPAVVAQKAATVGVLSDGRFTLGLGAGENLNEHVIGTGWPVARVRHERLEEAAQIIRALFTGGYVNFSGCHFEVERAKLYDLPDSPVRIGIAVSGAESVELAAEYADCMIPTEPDGSLVSGFEESGGPASRSTGRWRSATTLTRPPRGTAPASCGGGPPAADGTSCPSYPIPGRSRPSPARSARTRSPSSCRAGPTSASTWPRPGSSPRPASPTWPSSRWAATSRTSSSPGQSTSCWRLCGSRG
jgi:hypothetical protein